MGVRTNIPAVVAVAFLVTACSSTGEHKRLSPFPWPHKPTAKHGAAPKLPAANSGAVATTRTTAPARIRQMA